jgi:hypothetical protein
MIGGREERDHCTDEAMMDAITVVARNGLNEKVKQHECRGETGLTPASLH